MDILKYWLPLSEKRPSLGIEARTEALRSFVACIRDNLQVISGMAMEVREFNKLPSHLFQVFGKNPSYLTFVRIVLHVLAFCPSDSKVIIVCDEEETAISFYRLYQKVKREFPDARDKFGGIAFADSRYMFGVQAADLVASLMRLEASRRIAQEPYDYQVVYDELIGVPKKEERFLMETAVCIADHNNLQNVADGLKPIYEKALKQRQEEQQRIRELRRDNESTAEGSAQRDKSKAGRRESGEKAEV